MHDCTRSRSRPSYHWRHKARHEPSHKRWHHNVWIRVGSYDWWWKQRNNCAHCSVQYRRRKMGRQFMAPEFPLGSKSTETRWIHWIYLQHQVLPDQWSFKQNHYRNHGRRVPLKCWCWWWQTVERLRNCCHLRLIIIHIGCRWWCIRGNLRKKSIIPSLCCPGCPLGVGRRRRW